MAFYHWFYDAKNERLNFLTEVFPSGTLKE